MTTTQRMGTAPPIYLYPPRLSTPPSPPPTPSPKPGGPAKSAFRSRWTMLILPTLLFFMLILPYGMLRIWEVPHYQPIQTGMRVARVHATANGTLNSMNVELTLYKSDGSISYHHTYMLEGEKWLLRDEVIIYPSWTGLPAGYKIVQLTGYNAGNTNPAIKDKGILNGGEDSFYSFLKGNTWTSLLGKAVDYKVYVKPGPRPLGTTYDIHLNADGSLYTQQLENRKRSTP
jgi:hypothetical protein